ncbi:MAG TPA: TonB-dependent receptor [Candidatus Sulfotelmatobacter sp.]|nr:TonB-dependent receptor [Candidatus Sulfotelmatobacter sp.]
MRSSSRVVILLATSLLALQGLTFAQSATTSLRGTVTDPTGAAIPGAKVTLSSAERGIVHTATSGASGGYEFLQLQPGTYQLTVEKADFRRYEYKNISLLVDTPTTINVKLELGSRTEVVEVTAAGATINTTDASIGNAFDERQVKELPMEGRNVPDLLTLQAGVTYIGNRETPNELNVDTRGGAVNGAHSDQSNITLDGVDVNDQVNGYAFTAVLPVTLDSMQEFRVTTTNYGADAGRSSGAQVSLVTKSGTNKFHGSLYEYLRNTYTSANDYFVKASEVKDGSPNIPPKLIRNIFGGSLGGPFMKNRFYFFVNYEAARQREGASDLRIVPSDALRAGFLTYQCAVPSQCLGGSVPGDPTPVLGGYYALSPTQLVSMDPNHVGADPVMLSYFQTFPHANDFSQGDGFNFQGYRFSGPIPTNKNWYIARLDYKLNDSGTHTLFWRGALRNDNHSDAPYLPGTPPLSSLLDFSKGFTVGYTATLRPTLLNNFHYGYTRQSWGLPGNNDNTPVIFFRGLNDNGTPNNSSQAITRGDDFRSIVNNLVDDISWSKGKHTIQFGTNLRFIRSPRNNFINSFPSGTTNVSALDTAGFANTSSPFDPGNNHFPAVDLGFNNQYDYPAIALLGMVTQYSASFNFQKNGTALPVGAPVSRHWGEDEYEFYVQDSYRMKPNLTVNVGLRYSLFSPPWETTGTEVAPTFSMGQWFKLRAKDMLEGIGSNQDPTVTFALAGAANGKPGYYSWDFHNFGPRVSFAYTPRPDGGWLKNLTGEGDKTVIRAGFGIVYDHIGPGLLSSFDQNGSFGLSTQLTNSVLPSAATSPRLTSLTSVPTTLFDGVTPFAPPTPTGGFPYTPPPSGSGLGIYWGLDDQIKTPYSYALDLSVARELSNGLSLEVSYVGHLSHRLLAQEDLAMPLNLVDQKSGISYFAAANRFSRLSAAGTQTSAITPSLVGPTAAYWKNMMAPLKAGDQYNLSCTGNVNPNINSTGAPLAFTTDPLMAAYDLFSCFTYNETTALSALDYAGSDFNAAGVAGIAGMLTGGSGCGYANCPANYYPSILGQNAFFNSQFHSLYAWRSIANANYNALQVSLRKRMSHGLQFDVNYAYSKAIDLSSSAERVGPWAGVAQGSNIVNSWNPNQLRGVSDFDTTHQFNTNFIFELPVGKGKAIARNANGVANAIIGSWQLSGLARWTSGFPVSINNGSTWPTNWQLEGNATQIGPVHTGLLKQSTSTVPVAVPNLFLDPSGPTGRGAFRHDYPGESGGRNPVRGPGFAGLDAALSKTWKMPYAESHFLKFRWEVFNVLNHTEFDVASITNGIDQSGSFGAFSGVLTNPRVMQFAMRYEF